MPNSWPGFLDLRSPRNRQRLPIRAAILVYCFFALLLILAKPGLMYDEALLVLGSVHMRHSAQEIALPHDPHTWVHIFGRSIPLMTVRYVGSLKEYLCLPLFALFGTRTALIRLLSMVLGAFGIWGVAALVRDRLGTALAAFVAFLIAINPAYVATTVFDNGTVDAWMVSLALLSLAILGYVRGQTTAAAFWIGAAMGFGIWARANFLWMDGAVLLAAAVVLGRRILLPRAHWIAAAAGAVAGALPFLVYQVVSRGGTWEAVGMFSTRDSLSHQLFTRFILFAETLLSDREHRAMWDGPAMAAWQRWLFAAVVLAACLLCLLARKGEQRARLLWSRAVAIAFLALAAMLFLSPVTVSEHHLVALVPLAAIMTVLAGAALIARYPRARIGVAALATVYIGSALYWQFLAAEGLRRTGGVGPWSDGLIPLAQRLQQNYADREIKILDWGLQNNLYVVTDGRLHTREIFWDATQDRSGDRRTWVDELRLGGVFVLNAPAHRQFPDASIGFLRALDETRPVANRFVVPQRDGRPYAEVVEVEPNTIHQGLSSSINTGEPRFAGQLEGFYRIEEGGWRWTGRTFAVTLGPPALPPGKPAARVNAQLYIPDAVIQKLGAVTLAAKLNGRALAPQIFRQPGPAVFIRDVPRDSLAPGANRIEFTLDKALPPSATDERELGIVVNTVAFEGK